MFLTNFLFMATFGHFLFPPVLTSFFLSPRPPEVQVISPERLEFFQAITNPNTDVAVVKEMIAKGADVNAPGGIYELNASIIAQYPTAKEDLKAGHVGFFVESDDLINKPFSDIETLDRFVLSTPLVQATTTGNAEVIEALIKAGAKVNANGGTSMAYETPLINALEHKRDFEIINTLVKNGADVNRREYNAIPLGVALQNDADFAVIDLLVKHGAKVDASILQTASQKVTDPAIIELLIKKGAKTDGSLDYAVQNKNPAIMDVLIKNGAKSDKSYATLMLIQAVNSGDVMRATQAIANGADVNVKTGKYETPLLEYGKNPQIVTALVKAGADVNAKDKFGSSPVASAPNLEILKILLDNGADAGTAGRALMNIVEFTKDENLAMAQELINRGADVNAKDDQGQTPLMHATYHNNDPKMTELLIKAGADVNAKDKKGRTPLMYAAYVHKNPAIIEILIQNGADTTAKDNRKRTFDDYLKAKPYDFE